MVGAFLCVILTSTSVKAQTPGPTPGDAAFAAGNFDAAASAYTAALAINPDDPNAELGIGTTELYRNHVAGARTHLLRAVSLDPGSSIARARLAAIVKRTGGPEDYHIAFTAPQARIPLIAIDPLPTFKAKINGVSVTLLIDTGGPHLDLSESAIKRLHLATKAAGIGVFAGGLRAPVRSVHIDRFEVAGLTVRGIPGGVIPSQGAFPGVDGIRHRFSLPFPLIDRLRAPPSGPTPGIGLRSISRLCRRGGRHDGPHVARRRPFDACTRTRQHGAGRLIPYRHGWPGNRRGP